MLKKCPSCGRTYADETIAFCLADGDLLSPPYHPGGEKTGPPTEVLPAPVPPTETAQQPVPPIKTPMPTMTAVIPTPPRPTWVNNEAERANAKRIIVVTVFGLFVAGLLIAGIVLLVLRTRQTGSVKTANVGNINESLPLNPDARPATQNAGSPDNPTASPRASATPKSSPTDPKLSRPATIDADPALFPKDQRQLPSPTTGENDNRVFNGGEVNQKARILSKPEPVYTETARQNQVTGTVVLRAIFKANGQVTNITVVSGLPDGLSERAVAAARKIKFTPAIKDGHNVSMYFQLEYNFNLY